MNTIRIQPNGNFIKEGRAMAGDPFPFLNHAVELDLKCTLRSFFLSLVAYPDLNRLNPFFPIYNRQFKESAQHSCITEDFERLEFRKSIEMIGYPGTPRLEIFTSLRGIQSSTDVNIQPYTLSQLLDMPLTIGGLKHIIFGDNVDVFEFDTFITLFELIDGLAWELSFQNLPQQCELRR